MKQIVILSACALLLVGCSKTKEETSVDTSNGPVVEKQDQRTDSEKVLAMIQACVRNYNEDDLDELRTYYKSNIPNLPLEIDSLPEVNSLEDLTELTSEETSNVFYAGMYSINQYNVIFKVYYPSGADFWPNGEIEFQIDPENVTVNNPEYEQYRESLSYLLAEENNVIGMLYGTNAEIADEPTLDDRYYEVISINGTTYTSIQELKDYAESVFTTDYLEENYYKNAFEGDSPVYKEQDNKLYCLSSDVTPILSYEYCPDYIIYVKDDNGTVKVNLLTKVMDTILPDIKEITMHETENGYRLASAG